MRLTDTNRRLLDEASINIQGRTLAKLRRWLRKNALDAARHYTARLLPADTGDPPSIPPLARGGSVIAPLAKGGPGGVDPSDSCLIVTGHQPSLFHPGVWAKNAAVAVLSQRCGGPSLNLVIDNDLCTESRIRVPGGTRDEPRFDTLPFDAPRRPQPWEQARVLDAEVFAAFGEFAVEAMRPWNVHPIAAEIWPAAVESIGRQPLLRDALTAARRRMELRWFENLELPLSTLCNLEPARWFVAHLLAHLPRFRQIHNAVLADYRFTNGIRSRTHPVPDLGRDGEWLEAPFWVWRESDAFQTVDHKGGRRRLFAKRLPQGVELSADGQTLCTLPLAPDGDACCAVEALRELAERGWRLRPRALTTTLLARLCLADLFVHGIGGAKYDEITDRIVEQFFQLAAPRFLTLSATLHLPLAERFSDTPEDARRLRAQLRDLNHNPDRHLSPHDGETRELIAEKRRLIAAQQAAQQPALSRRERRGRRHENRRRYLALRDVNERLAPRTSELEWRLTDELRGVTARLEANRLFTDREWSYCLYPAERLERLIDRLHAGEQACACQTEPSRSRG
ncbi:MAG: hypothetical protein KY476_14560 [Planctomycetes bacterium]|nr:hypothetical protein [Planctomycetota bacterium]